ncbi:hypothetical protein BGX33_000203 [Mortierella sp. NVP41]|nr:hypothetical protein BGX33_000203 [Mortierella sp. NVP41]
MNGRLTVHAAADNVIVKRQRIELEEEGRSLDEGLQSRDHPVFVDDLPTERDASSCEQEDDLMAGQITPTKRVQGHSDIVPLVKVYDLVRYSSFSGLALVLSVMRTPIHRSGLYLTLLRCRLEFLA